MQILPPMRVPLDILYVLNVLELVSDIMMRVAV